MTPEKNMPISHDPKLICPYLGWSNDEQTFNAFPVIANSCHHVHPPEPVSKKHQADFCLAPTFSLCPVFVDTWFGQLPGKISATGDRKHKRKKSWLRAPLSCFVAALATLIVLISAWFTINRIIFGLKKTPVFNSTYIAYLIASPTSDFSYPTLMPLPAFRRTLTPRPTRTSTAVITPTISQTQIPTPGPEFETPISSQLPFFIHEVILGDTIYNLALTFNTSPDAISKINGINNTRLLFIGQVIVIPRGITDPSSLPLIVVYQVPSGGETLAGIANYYGTDPSEIRYYNNLSESTYLPEGRWLIIPLLLYTPTPNIPAGTLTPTLGPPASIPTNTP